MHKIEVPDLGDGPAHFGAVIRVRDRGGCGGAFAQAPAEQVDCAVFVHDPEHVPAQLEVLRACDFIARHGSVDVQDALAVIIRSLFADSGPQQAKRRLA